MMKNVNPRNKLRFISRVVESTFPNRVYKASTIARDQAISDGVRHEGDVREQQRGLQEEAADRLGARSTLGGQITADGMAPGSIARRHADSRQAHDR
jgi:hypothetical protein